MICLNYLKSNMKTYICESKNYFGTTEGDLKLSIIIIKSHSHPVLIKKQHNYEIKLELKRQR